MKKIEEYFPKLLKSILKTIHIHKISELHLHGLAKVAMHATNVLADRIFDDRN